MTSVALSQKKKKKKLASSKYNFSCFWDQHLNFKKKKKMKTKIWVVSD